MADRLSVVTYNLFRERNGRDALLENVLGEGGALVCLQEVAPWRAAGLKLRFGRRAFVSPAKYGLQYLAMVLPVGGRFVERRTASLNGYGGFLPRAWSLRRGFALRKAGRRAWVDGLEPRVAQVARVSWRGKTFRVANTHLPFEPWLRDRCLEMLPRLAGGAVGEEVLMAGDFNSTVRGLFLNDLLLCAGLRAVGDRRATCGGHRIDFVLCRGLFRDAGYSVEEGASDHRLVRAELEV